MKKAILFHLFLVSVAASAEIEFIEVADTGNEPDQIALIHSTGLQYVRPLGAIMDIGAVDYPFQIARYEISYDQYQVAIDGGLVFDEFNYYDTFQDAVTRYGIFEDAPALVNPVNAAAFVNWMNESEGYPPAYKFDFSQSTGLDSWSIGEAGFNPKNPHRNSLSKYVLPDANEWHKAAHYNPESQTYSEYTTGDLAPIAVAEGNEPGTAVFAQPFSNGPVPIDLAGGESAYGAVGMAGNVMEWEESPVSLGEFAQIASPLTFRGGFWATDADDLDRRLSAGEGRDGFTGFRIVQLDPDQFVVGDYNSSGSIDPNDIDLLSEFALAGVTARAVLEHREFDLNTDGHVNGTDRELWLTHVAKTSPGDSDLDGDVDFVDFLGLANNFGVSPTSWSQGDYDGNNETNFLDFLALASNFGNEGVSTAAVPEPSSSLLAFLLVVPALLSRRRRAA